MIDGVLRGDHQEWRFEHVRFAVDGDPPFRHRFEQSGLRSRRRAIDFIRQHDLGKKGPGTEFEFGRFGVEDRAPVMSLGSKSGVHCTRLNEHPTLAAKARASIVLATPGTSSSRICPSDK